MYFCMTFSDMQSFVKSTCHVPICKDRLEDVLPKNEGSKPIKRKQVDQVKKEGKYRIPRKGGV